MAVTAVPSSSSPVFVEGAQLGEQREAVHLRHVDVAHDDVRRLVLGTVQRLGAARGDDHAEAVRRQQALEDRAGRGLVVDHEDAATGSRSGLGGRRRCHWGRRHEVQSRGKWG
jgi:hypothetical protein